MNGPYSNPSRSGDKSSLDALNRTIEGLEARIEELIAEGGHDPAAYGAPRRDTDVSGILQRQQALEKARGGQSTRSGASLADNVRARFSQSGQPASGAPAPRMRPNVAQETNSIAQALAGLRQELKSDIAETVSRQMSDFHNELRQIRADAGNVDITAGLREDLEKLAVSIEAAGQHASPRDAANLRAEFDELRQLIDGLARQDSLKAIENRWDRVEARLERFDPATLENEVLGLAGRVEDIKAQLGGMNSSPAIHALEEKLVNIASAVEMFGKHIPVNNGALENQLSNLDQRLDEISRAIAAKSAQSADTGYIEKLEARLGLLVDQIEDMSKPRQQDELAGRIEALAHRMEEIADARAAEQLEARIEHLTQMLERVPTTTQHQPDLSGVLSDISGKIDRIETASGPAPVNDALFVRLESRLEEIASRLDETVNEPAGPSVDLSNLEEQIAGLSALLATPGTATHAASENAGLENRMAALEDYMAANDEYILEAARQAAEAVAASLQQNGGQSSGNAGHAEIAALSQDLRALEKLTRSSEDRNQRTFEALHDTLIQIAERIDTLGNVSVSAPAPAPMATAQAASQASPEMPKASEPAFGQNDRALEAEMNNAVGQLSELDRADGLATAERRDEENRDHGARGLLGGLKKKLSARNEEPQPARQNIAPTPALDAADDMTADVGEELSNELLEPGSGAPDIKSILKKVRENKSEGGGEDGDRADYIAAARRAAQAAAAEVAAQGEQSKASSSDGDGKSKSIRRPLMLAAGAVLLAVMSYPLASSLIGGSKDAAPVVSEHSPEAVIAPESETNTPPVIEQDMAEAPQDETIREVTPTAPDNAEGNFVIAEDATLDDAAVAATDATGEDTLMATADDATSQDVAMQMPVISDVDIPETLTPASLVQAAKEQDPLAFFEIATRYAEGRGVEPDLKEAVTWYERAAELGFAPAEYRLGNMYEKASGVERDLERARAYYVSAAEKGNVSAMHNLAVLFATGVDGTPDFEASAQWFEMAAKHGVKDSQFNLAILYAKGSGVQANFEESYRWFAIAASAGDADAAQKRDEVAKALSSDQLERLKKDVALWKPLPVDDSANSTLVPDEWIGEGKSTSSVDMKKAIRNIQAILNNNGFDAGPADGVMGARTVNAIKSFQKSAGMEPDGQISEKLVRGLLALNQ